jgi:hypothetical protein
VTLTLTTDDPTGPCGAVNDSMTITINSAVESVTITSITQNLDGTLEISYTGGSGTQFVLEKSADVTAPRSSGSPSYTSLWTTVATLTSTPNTFHNVPALAAGEFFLIESK